MNNHEFYIGWLAKAPVSFAKFIRKYLLLCGISVVLIAALLALSQKRFSTGNFEFGTLTEIKGLYFPTPVPHILMVNGKDIWGKNILTTVPLIGYGKFGATGCIADIEKEKNISLAGKEVSMKGTLLYNDGKLLLQIDKNDSPLVRYTSTLLPTAYPNEEKDLGMQTLRGEIIDPKCFFGVMKPGEGKPHKDCAVRCLLGGMPPILVVRNQRQEANYYLLVGAHGESINESIKDFVAEPVELQAKAVQYNDWIVLYVNPKQGLSRYSYLREHYGNNINLCANTCIK